jgi:Dyp-type peroxidase family
MKADASLAALLDNHDLITDGDPDYAPILSDLQPNILTGHGRDNACFFLLQLAGGADASKQAAALVQALLQHLDFPSELDVRAQRRRRPGKAAKPADGPVAVLLFTASGYAKLGVAAPSDSAFQAGMAARAAALNDPSPTSWDPRYRGIDALLLVAFDDAKFPQLPQVEGILRQHGATFSVERGNTLRARAGYPIEPFGFRDGISQPLFYASDLAYKIAQGVVPATAARDASAPLGLAVCADPNGGTPFSCGSYFVLRKLRQRVDLFYEQVGSIAAATGRPDEEILAEVMGRRRDGQPLTQHTGLNGYDYKDDSAGAVCPFHTHTRKMNPRSDLPGSYLPRTHRMVRRAVAYGPSIPRDDTGRPTQPAAATDDLGLLFMCAQAQPTLQYEHVQSAWANNRLAGGKLVGVDALMGQTSGGELNRIAFRTLDPATGTLAALPVRFDWRPVVETRGGDYFFAPSLSFLQNLAVSSGSSGPS